MMSPKGFPCRLASAISMSFSSASFTCFVDEAMRFAIRATGRRLAWARPCPLLWRNPSTG